MRNLSSIHITSVTSEFKLECKCYISRCRGGVCSAARFYFKVCLALHLVIQLAKHSTSSNSAHLTRIFTHGRFCLHSLPAFQLPIMQLSAILLSATFACLASAQLTYTIQEASNPTSDQTDAYARIKSAMDAALARHKAQGSKASKTLTVEYNTGVATADGSINGNIRFGSSRSYMTERTALHEIAHTLGVGTTDAFTQNCNANDWPTALPLLRSFDGASATITCGGDHFWPYGLNYESEMSDTNADRHVDIVNAMIVDGI